MLPEAVAPSSSVIVTLTVYFMPTYPLGMEKVGVAVAAPLIRIDGPVHDHAQVRSSLSSSESLAVALGLYGLLAVTFALAGTLIVGATLAVVVNDGAASSTVVQALLLYAVKT